MYWQLSLLNSVPPFYHYWQVSVRRANDLLNHVFFTVFDLIA